MSDSSITPNIHLALGDDADVNRNWEILDQAIKAIGLRTIIPDNVLIQGNLEVAGNTQLDGTLQVAAPTTLGILNVSNTATFLSAVAMDGAVIIPNGPLTLPPGGIAGAALAPGASTFLVQTGTANTAQQTIGTTPTQIATLLMDPSEDANLWQLVICQATINVVLSADTASTNNAITLTMRRGGAAGADQQTRTLSYTLSRTTYMQIPLTMLRLTKPPQLDEKRWSLTANHIGGLITFQSTFAQVHCIQFR